MAELPPGVSMEKLLALLKKAQAHNEREKQRYQNRISTEEGRAKILGYAKDNYERNRERILAERKRRYAENRELLLARAKLYQTRKKNAVETEASSPAETA